MKTLLCCAFAFSAWLTGSAMAADLPIAPLVYTGRPVVIFDWTGCYVGGNVGGLWLRKDNHYAAPTTPVGADLGSHDASNVLGGVQAGCNYQFAGGWMIGLQGDVDFTDAVGSHTDLVVTTRTDRSRTRVLSSVTGRVGYAWDRFLSYVKGGFAWERDDYDTYTTATGAVLANATEMRGGWTVGVGSEYALTQNFTIFAEYNYYDFGTRTILFNTTPTPYYSDIGEHKSVAKAGFNFKFGGGDSIAARY